ncbi:GumC family protein [Pajaroellobacter abortibovis]|uniref:AAA domain-containing protein n=1 Tax=Pajaroellobacter abortibovis TaxID=1882918 RepID=A0A1L6MVR5_9BACT|nr:polysaccharide biosynthesis tyrosine autokinase [Pajaroellobacter abortibovis]APR99601.1 hypothetical protein BCY86_02085 [Pajaroellobacter abortibovis]
MSQHFFSFFQQVPFLKETKIDAKKVWIVLASVIMMSSLVVFISRFIPKKYQSIAMVEFDPNPAPLMYNKEYPVFLNFFDNQEYYQTQYKIITSDRVLSRVVRELDLENDPVFMSSFGNKTGISLADMMDALRHQVFVEPIRNSRLVLVKVENADPKRAAYLCNAVVQAYVKQNLEKSINATADASLWLGEQVDRVKRVLEEDERSIYLFKEKNKLPSTSINEASNVFRLELQAYEEALTKTRTRKQELLAHQAELAKLSSEDPNLIITSGFLNNPFLQTLRSEYMHALKERSEMVAEGKGENYPAVWKVNEKIAQCRATLLAEVKNIQMVIEKDLQILERQEQGELRLYEDARKRAVELSVKEIEYNRLERSRKQNESLYTLLMERMKQADLERMMNVNNIRIVDNASESKKPISPRVGVNAVVGAVIGLILGVSVIVLQQTLDNTIKTPEDVEEKLKASYLGSFPHVREATKIHSYFQDKKLRKRTNAQIQEDAEELSLIAHRYPLGGIAEAARIIRTNLMFVNPDNPCRSFLVSSSMSGEGKTTTACTMAIAIAQAGHRVCIVDGDLRKPRLAAIFNRQGDVGLTNLLIGNVTFEDVSKPTEVEGLWSIPSGPIPPNPGDIVHSEKVNAFLEQVKKSFDFVLIDSPPLVAVTDGALMATKVDGVIFVIRSGKTTYQVARRGLRALSDVSVKVVGVVLNAVNSRERGYYHYYNYYSSELDSRRQDKHESIPVSVA